MQIVVHKSKTDLCVYCLLYLVLTYYSAMVVRYGSQAVADELSSLYGVSRAEGFGSEVLLMKLHYEFFSVFLFNFSQL